MADDTLLAVIRVEARMKALAHELRFIGQAIAEIVSSSTTAYSHMQPKLHLMRLTLLTKRLEQAQWLWRSSSCWQDYCCK